MSFNLWLNIARASKQQTEKSNGWKAGRERRERDKQAKKTETNCSTSADRRMARGTKAAGNAREIEQSRKQRPLEASRVARSTWDTASA